VKKKYTYLLLEKHHFQKFMEPLYTIKKFGLSKILKEMNHFIQQECIN